MLSIAAKEWMAEGAAKGEAKGEAKGKVEGKADTLFRLLRRRFQTLPSHLEDSIRAADIDRLDEWIDRILDAKSLDDVFGTDQRH